MSYIVVSVNLEKTMYNVILEFKKDYQVTKFKVKFWICLKLRSQER